MTKIERLEQHRKMTIARLGVFSYLATRAQDAEDDKALARCRVELEISKSRLGLINDGLRVLEK